MKPPEDVEGLFDLLESFQAEVRTAITLLPPTPAKDLMQNLLAYAEPKVGELRSAYPDVVEAFEKQQTELDEMKAQTIENIEKAKATLNNAPPVEMIQRNLVPLVPAIPAGLSLQFADEMRDRYVPAVADQSFAEGSGAAWQDWSLNL